MAQHAAAEQIARCGQALPSHATSRNRPSGGYSAMPPRRGPGRTRHGIWIPIRNSPKPMQEQASSRTPRRTRALVIGMVRPPRKDDSPARCNALGRAVASVVEVGIVVRRLFLPLGFDRCTWRCPRPPPRPQGRRTARTGRGRFLEGDPSDSRRRAAHSTTKAQETKGIRDRGGGLRVRPAGS